MCTKEIQIVNLGYMNGWNTANPPAAYVKHLHFCGEEHESRYYLGDPTKFETRKYRSYSLIGRNLGNCHNEYTCNQCGIQYIVDSSD